MRRCLFCLSRTHMHISFLLLSPSSPLSLHPTPLPFYSSLSSTLPPFLHHSLLLPPSSLHPFIPSALLFCCPSLPSSLPPSPLFLPPFLPPSPTHPPLLLFHPPPCSPEEAELVTKVDELISTLPLLVPDCPRVSCLPWDHAYQLVSVSPPL